MANVPLMESGWKEAQRNIFRLEALPLYRVSEDLILFNKWKKGKLNINLEFKK